jgi:PAS domain S-box-containing protein
MTDAVDRRRMPDDRDLQRYQALYELAPVSLLTLDADGVIIEANSRAQSLLGSTGHTLTGKRLVDFVRSEDAERVQDCVDRVHDDGPIEDACVFTPLQSRPFRAWITASPIHSDSGGRDDIIVALADLERELAPVERLAEEIVAHRESRSELDATRKHLEAIVESAVDGIVTADPEGIIEYANAAAEEIFGYPSGELIGMDVFSLVPSLVDSEQIPDGGETIGVRRDGTRFPAHIAVAEIEVDGQRRFTGTVRDLTERKHLEKQLVQAQRMEAIGTLSTGVAHDFNNLIMGITGSLDLATRTVDADNPAQDHLNEIRESLQSGASIARQLLAFARRGEPTDTPCAVDDVVLRVRNVFGPLLGEEITLDTSLATQDELARVDPGQLEQVLLNLAINGRDAMPSGGILRIATDVVELDEPLEVPGEALGPGRYVRVTVADTGTGIPDELLPQIFEPFYTTKPPGSGTGLGLSMVFGTLQSVGGGVRVQSTMDVGTTFELFLPIYDEQAEPGRLSTDEYARVVQSDCTVLLVEDDRLVAQAVRQQLADLGHRPIIATSVDEAWKKAAQHADEVDLVLTDSVLPDGFGRDVAQIVAELLPDAGVIFMSAHGRDALLASDRVFEEHEFLLKPFESEELQRALVRTLGRRADCVPDPPKRCGSVLIVDDHDMARNAFVEILREEGFEVTGAASITEALNDVPDDPVLLVTDVKLPDGVGPDLADAMTKDYPDLAVVYCSGHPHEAVVEDYRVPADAPFLRKPFEIDELVEMVGEVVQRGQPPAHG